MQVRLLDRSRTGPSVRKELDADGDGTAHRRQIFAYDGNQIVFDLQRDGSSDLQIGHVRQRYLWGPAVERETRCSASATGG